MEEQKEVIRKEEREAIPGGTVVKEKTSISPVPEEQKGLFQSWMLIYYLTSLLEILFAFRLVFKGLGANPLNGFVSFIYNVTGFFLAPFLGIFPPAVSKGVETTAVFEPATVIAMIVYALVAWGLANLITIKLSGGSSK